MSMPPRFETLREATVIVKILADLVRTVQMIESGLTDNHNALPMALEATKRNGPSLWGAGLNRWGRSMPSMPIPAYAQS